MSFIATAQNGAIDSITAGTEIELNFNYPETVTIPALVKELQRTYKATPLTGATGNFTYRIVSVSGKARVEFTVQAVKNSDDDTYLTNLKVGSTLWFARETTTVDFEIETATRAIGTNFVSFTITTKPSVPVYYGINLVLNNSYGLRFTSGESIATPTKTVPGAPVITSIGQVTDQNFTSNLSSIIYGNITKITINLQAPITNGGSPVTSYLIQYSTVSENTGFIAVKTLNKTNALVQTTTFDLPSTYAQIWIRVYAINAIGTSTNFAKSNLTMFWRTDDISNLTATPYARQIQLNWKAPSNVGNSPYLYYFIYRSTTKSGTYFYQNFVATTSFLDTGLTANTTYYYRIVPWNGYYTSGSYEDVSATALAVSKPGPPTNLAINADTGIGITNLTLTWDEPTQKGGTTITGYRIDRSTSANSGFATIVASQTARSYNNTGLTANTRYYYRVYSINSAGTSDTYASVSATTKANTLPKPPKNLTVSSNNAGTQITVSWAAPDSWGTGTTTSRKYEYRVGSGTWTEVDDSLTTATISNAQPGATYIVYLRAKTNLGNSDAVSGSVTMSNPNTVPNAPTSVSASSGFDGQSYTVTYKAPTVWGNAPTNTRKFQYKHNNASNWTEVDDSILAVTISGLTAGVKYNFKIRSKTANGESSTVSIDITTSDTDLVAVSYNYEYNSNGHETGDWDGTDEFDVADPAKNRLYLSPYLTTRYNAINERRTMTFNGNTYTVQSIAFASFGARQVMLIYLTTEVSTTGLVNGTTYTFSFDD